jgi:hypothetical protein
MGYTAYLASRCHSSDYVLSTEECPRFNRAPQAVKGEVQEGESLLQKYGEPSPAPHLGLRRNFLLWGRGLLCGFRFFDDGGLLLRFTRRFLLL